MNARPISPPLSLHLPIAALSLALASPAFAIDRVWDGATGAWATQTNWSPNGWPAFEDHVFIGTTDPTRHAIVNMDINATVAALTIGGEANLNTEGQRLTVNGLTRLDGDSDSQILSSHARLQVTNGASGVDFEADGLDIWSASYVQLVSDPDIVVNGPLTIQSNASLIGNGAVTVTAGSIVNNGEISLYGGDSLIQLGGGNLFDLDGTTGNGKLTINGAGTDVQIAGQGIADAFDGDMFLAGDTTLQMSLNSSWSIGPNGQVLIAGVGTNGGETTISGSPLGVAGELQINGTSNALALNADMTFEDSAMIHVGTDNSLRVTGDAVVSGGTFVLGQGSELEFDGPTIMDGGDFATASGLASDGAVLFNGPTTWHGTIAAVGLLRQMGDATVTGVTTINATAFDLDGGGANWNINNILTINAEAIDELALPNAFNTQMTIGPSLFGRLVVNLNDPVYWQMNGQMTIIGDANLFPTRIAGNTMNVGGTLTLASGRAHIGSDLILGNGSTTTIANGATLQTGGYTQIYGNAAFGGSGTLRNAVGGTLSLDDQASLGDVGVVNAGSFRVSLYPAIASVGRFENVAGGVVTVNVTGDVVGDEHDQLVVSSGPATLAGELRVNHRSLDAGAFDAQVGDEFTIITAVGGVNGTFEANPVSYRWGERFEWTVVYNSNDVKLQLTAISDCGGGDTDDDGDTDLQDLANLLAHFGTLSGADWNDGDLDGDGDVELQDLAILLAAFGTRCN